MSFAVGDPGHVTEHNRNGTQDITVEFLHLAVTAV